MDANLMVILTATLAVTSGISLVVFLNLLFIRTLWNDNTTNSYRDAISESAMNNYAGFNSDNKNLYENENEN